MGDSHDQRPIDSKPHEKASGPRMGGYNELKKKSAFPVIVPSATNEIPSEPSDAEQPKEDTLLALGRSVKSGVNKIISGLTRRP